VTDGFLEESTAAPYQLSGTKANLIVEWEVYSPVYSEKTAVFAILQGDFTCTAPFKTLVSKLPPVLDVIFEGIANRNLDAFKTLLSVLNLIPFGEKDSRPMSQMLFNDPAISPLAHLSFYARYCAFRNQTNIDSFLECLTI
jgi:hypothetical protein